MSTKKVAKKAVKKFVKKVAKKVVKKAKKSFTSTKTTKDFKHCGEKGIKLDPEFEKLRDALIEYTRTNGKHLIISFCSKDDMAQNTIMCSRAFLMNFCGDVVKDLMEGQM